MKLIIDSSQFDKTILAIANNFKIIKKVSASSRFTHEEVMLKLMDKLFTTTKIAPKDIVGVIVVNGPGSFSALRIGLSVANTLAWQLNIPIVGVSNKLFKNLSELHKIGLKLLSQQQEFQIVLPNYGQPPSINIKKNSLLKKRMF